MTYMLLPYTLKNTILLMQTEQEQEFKEINDKEYNTILDDATKSYGQIRKSIKKAADRLYETDPYYKEHPDKISAQIRRDCDLRGWELSQLDYIRRCLPDEFKDQSKVRSFSGTSSTLENLNLGISTEELTKKLESSTDYMPLIAKKRLTLHQLGLLSDSEKQQYVELRTKEKSEQKTNLHNADEYDKEVFQLAGIKNKEEKDRKSTQIPPKALWGKSDTYEFLLAEAEALDCVVKYLYDVAKQVYVFKLGKGLDRELQKDLEEMHDKVIIPMSKVSILKTNMVKYILDNVQDEKNRDTLCGWIEKAVHKFSFYGNHGTGEVDFIETGEHIMKLVSNQDEIDEAVAEGRKPPKLTYSILRIPIFREFTREQISDKTVFELVDSNNQMFIECPQCHLKWNKPIITDEKRDVIAGDYFNKALNILVNDPVNRVIEKICDNVMTVQLKTPEEFFKEEYKKREKELKGITFKDIKVINMKPIKIKEEDLLDSQKTDVSYNIFFGRANRTWAKSEYFSGKA